MHFFFLTSDVTVLTLTHQGDDTSRLSERKEVWQTLRCTRVCISRHTHTLGHMHNTHALPRPTLTLGHLATSSGGGSGTKELRVPGPGFNFCITARDPGDLARATPSPLASASSPGCQVFVWVSGPRCSGSATWTRDQQRPWRVGDAS